MMTSFRCVSRVTCYIYVFFFFLYIPTGRLILIAYNFPFLNTVNINNNFMFTILRNHVTRTYARLYILKKYSIYVQYLNELCWILARAQSKHATQIFFFFLSQLCANGSRFSHAENAPPRRVCAYFILFNLIQIFVFTWILLHGRAHVNIIYWI